MALPEKITNNETEIASLLENMSRVQEAKEGRLNSGSNNGNLFTETVKIPEIKLANGHPTRQEEGPRIDMKYLKKCEVDPKKVLFFRITQPAADAPKPELYWTTDYYETLRGLTQEISTEKRKTAIILISDLETVNQNGGLIRDVNDDEGLAVWQIGSNEFDQNLALAKIKPNYKF